MEGGGGACLTISHSMHIIHKEEKRDRELAEREMGLQGRHVWCGWRKLTKEQENISRHISSISFIMKTCRVEFTSDYDKLWMIMVNRTSEV